ncbi:extracellular solute-binding protein [Paenibacillus sp. TRM 82003]|nr:extracellular solute-binding protein [Paenibacillus sp. TRM 82003]
MKLRIATHDEQRMAVIQEAVKQFRREHPDVTVLLELVPDRDALWRQWEQGDAPDIVEWEGGNMGEWMAAGRLSDLTDLIRRDVVDLDDYYPCVRQAIADDEGRVGALPVMAETLGVYYNKEHFDEAGLPYPADGWSWNEFVAAAERLTRRDAHGNVTRYGVFTSFGYMIYIEPLAWNNGGSFLGEDGRTLDGYLNAPETIGAFRQYLDVIDRGLSPRLGVGQESWIDCFIHGKMSMYFDANWAIKPMGPEQRAKFGVVGIPSNRAPRQNLFQIYGYGIPKGCGQRQLAWSFLRKLTAPGGGVDKLWTVLNLATSRTTAETSGQAADDLYKVFLDELRYGRPSAYQYYNRLVPVLHYNDTFRELRHASDAERVLQGIASRTPALPPFDTAKPPGG